MLPPLRAPTGGLTGSKEAPDSPFLGAGSERRIDTEPRRARPRADWHSTRRGWARLLRRIGMR